MTRGLRDSGFHGWTTVQPFIAYSQVGPVSLPEWYQ